MVLVDVEREEVGRWEILATSRASVEVILRAVEFKVLDRREVKRVSVRRQRALHGVALDGRTAR